MTVCSWPVAFFGDRSRIADLRRRSIYPLAAFGENWELPESARKRRFPVGEISYQDSLQTIGWERALPPRSRPLATGTGAAATSQVAEGRSRMHLP